MPEVIVGDVEIFDVAPLDSAVEGFDEMEQVDQLRLLKRFGACSGSDPAIFYAEESLNSQGAYAAAKAIWPALYASKDRSA